MHFNQVVQVSLLKLKALTMFRMTIDEYLSSSYISGSQRVENDSVNL